METLMKTLKTRNLWTKNHLMTLRSELLVKGIIHSQNQYRIHLQPCWFFNYFQSECWLSSDRLWSDSLVGKLGGSSNIPGSIGIGLKAGFGLSIIITGGVSSIRSSAFLFGELVFWFNLQRLYCLMKVLILSSLALLISPDVILEAILTLLQVEV